MASYRKKPCKKNQARNPATGRCIKRSVLAKLKKSKSCKKDQVINPATGRCIKRSALAKLKKSKPVVRKSPSKYLKKDVAEGECRGRTMESCKGRPNCTYRKNIGCVKKYGVVKNKYNFKGPIRRTPKKSPQSFKSSVHPTGVNFFV